MTGAILALALLVTTGTEAAEARGESPVILDFTATWCGPCQSMRPAVEALERNGYPVRAVDIDQRPELAERYQVRGVPTFVYVDRQGRELGRVTGARPASELAALYRKAQARLDARRPATADAARADDAATTTVRAQNPSEEDESGDAAEPVAAADADAGTHFHPWESVVRIKVHNHLSRPRPSIGFGSGTVIHSTAEESIILTCAHIFHADELPRGTSPSKFPLKVVVDLFDGRLRDSNTPNKTPYVLPAETDIPAQVIDYDFSGDVGLIRIRPGRALPYSKVVPPGWAPQKGQKLNTLGCSEGRPATAWTTRVTNPLIRFQSPGRQGVYEGTECSHPPLQGRSGGGLFTMDGLLAGVCDFNDGPHGHGLYASPKTIHRLLDRHRLQVCYADEAPRPRPDRAAIARNEPPRDAGAKIRAQSPQLSEALMPIPSPEMMGARLPEGPGSERAAPVAAGSDLDRRYRWQPAPGPHVDLAGQTTRAHDAPRTAGLALDPDATGGDFFLLAPEPAGTGPGAEVTAEPAAPVESPRRPAVPSEDHWRPAPVRSIRGN